MPFLNDYDDRIVGTQGYLFYGDEPGPGDPAHGDPIWNPDGSNNLDSGSYIPITRWSMQSTRATVDWTSSVWYDAETYSICPVSIVTAVKHVLVIEGRFRINSLNGTILKDLEDATAVSRVRLGLTYYQPYGSGLFQVVDYSMSLDVGDVVNYTCLLKSYGKFILG
jgi:hypothetical protein